MSGEGWKQIGDDPYHTDWMLGAGLDLELWDTDKTLKDAAYDASHILQHAGGGGLRGTILVPLTSPLSGVVVHPAPNQEWWSPGDELKIVVLPNLSPQYVMALKGASLVIAENGGALAHLSQLGMEQGIPIFRLPYAREELPAGSSLQVAPSGLISVIGASI